METKEQKIRINEIIPDKKVKKEVVIEQKEEQPIFEFKSVTLTEEEKKELEQLKKGFKP